MPELEPSQDPEEAANRTASRHLLQIILLISGPLIVLVVIFLGRAVIDRRNGCQDRLHRRANDVNPASILRLPILAQASIPTEDLRTLDRRAPFGYRANVLMQRAETSAAAGQVFDALCQNGWTFEVFNHYDRSHFSYGGQGDERYCASQVIQNRFSMGYAPGCGSSRDYVSYVIVQRGDVIFAAYERVASWANSGQHANQALGEAMRQLGQKPA